MFDMYECLKKTVNEEQLLDFALGHICERNFEDAHSVATMIVTLYILQEWDKKGKRDFTEDEIDARFKELIADRILTDLSRKDLVEVSFDDCGQIMYRLSEKGKEVLEKLGQ